MNRSRDATRRRVVEHVLSLPPGSTFVRRDVWRLPLGAGPAYQTVVEVTTALHRLGHLDVTDTRLPGSAHEYRLVGRYTAADRRRVADEVVRLAHAPRTCPHCGRGLSDPPAR